MKSNLSILFFTLAANGGVIGGCSVYFVPKRIDKRWTVEMLGIMDP